MILVVVIAMTAPSIFIDDVPLDDPQLEQPTDNSESAGLIQTATGKTVLVACDWLMNYCPSLLLDVDVFYC